MIKIERPCGFISGFDYQEKENGVMVDFFDITGIYVLPGSRSHTYGIGLLWDILEKTNALYIRCYVPLKNENLISYYISLGFINENKDFPYIQLRASRARLLGMCRQRFNFPD